MTLPDLVNLLDISYDSGAFIDSVHISQTELAGRVHELPPPYRHFWVYDPYEMSGCEESLDFRKWSLLEEEPLRGDPRRCRLWEYNALIDTLPTRKIGKKPTGPKALDLGCGSGRDAVALACLGWQVTACDHLPKSLDLARDLERRYSDGIPITWIEQDLRHGIPEGSFDAVTAFFFWKPEAIVQASRQLNPGGTLLIEMFTPTDQEKHGKPKHPTDSNELRELFPHLEEIKIEEDWRPSGRHTVQAILKRI